MTEAVSAKQIFDLLSTHDLERVSFQTSDGLPIVALYVETDAAGGATITLSDQLPNPS